MIKLHGSRLLSVLLAVLLFSTAVFPCTEANAMASSLNPAALCSVTVKTPENMEHLKQTEFTVKLYRFASVDANVHYTLLDGYSAVTTEPDSIKPNMTENLIKLASEVAAVVEANPELSSESVTVKNGEGKKEGLPTGLYLIVPETAYTDDKMFTMEPFVMALPNGENMPVDGSDSTREDWNYDLTLFLKANEDDRTGKLRITKTFTSFNKTFSPENKNLGSAVAVFKVRVVKHRETGDEVIYNSVVSMHFDNPGTDVYELTGLPVGSEATVSEVYSGGAYRLAESSVNYEDHLVIAYDEGKENEPPLTFTFVNEYDESLKTSVSVTNHYTLREAGYSGEQTKETPDYKPQKEADK